MMVPLERIELPSSDYKTDVLPFNYRGKLLAEAVRFELTDPLEPLVFKTSAIDHSTTLPLFGAS
jgi:hypothetical protein